MSEREKLLELALEAIRDGNVPRPVRTPWRADGRPSKHDRCTHDVWMYEDCGSCISTYADSALRARAAGEER